jgi:hypothetical protein
MHTGFTLQLDHLIVIAPTLEDGARFIADTLGIAPVEGGVHRAMGTHNRLLGLWGGAYLEVIAIDPQGERAGTIPRRWFALDDDTMQARLANGPFLAHWAARVPRPKDLTRWQAQYPQRIAPVMPMSRGDLTWRLTVPADGTFPAWQGAGDGLLPTLIQWDTAQHPGARLPETGLALRALKGRHPQAARLRDQLAWLGAAHLIDIEETTGEPALVAEIETPDGIRVLGAASPAPASPPAAKKRNKPGATVQ